jgi:formylglycine-generating enzyme required for sulfatase activity
MKNFVFTLVPLLIIIGCQKELNFTNNIDGSGPNIDGNGPLNIETSLIPSGTFTMGSPISEQLREPDEEQHQVTLSAFRMSKYEISNTLYAAFLNAKGIDSSAIYAAGTYPTEVLIYSNSTSGLIWSGTQWQPVVGKENFPVVNLTWYGAFEFANYAGGRLPTEAEWEYACRGGAATPFNTGNCLDYTQANYVWDLPYSACNNANTSYPGLTQVVNIYSPNSYGLYNMHGNVVEWCADWYAPYSTAPQTNPTGPTAGTFRIYRGGGYGSDAKYCRSAIRNFENPNTDNGAFGLRLVFTP